MARLCCFLLFGVLVAGCARSGPSALPSVEHVRFLSTSQSGGTPASGVVSNYVPVHAYMGFASGGCEGGQPAANVVQSVMRYVEACGSFDPSIVCPQTQAPPPGAPGCNGEYYVSTTYIFCDVVVQQNWYQQLNGTESAFLHTATPIAASNRLSGTNPGAKCPAPGQTTASNYFYWSNPADASNRAYWLQNWFTSGPVSQRAYVYTLLDNMEWGRPYSGGEPVEFASVQSWRQALGGYSASFTNGGVPYGLEENALGPGGGNYGPNNASGAGEGVVNDAIDVTDVCDADASASNISAYISERPWEAPSGTRLLAGGNPKVLVNTASLFWSDVHCAANFEQLNASDTLALRIVSKAMEFIMTRPGSQGAPGKPSVADWRYPIGVTLNTADAASEVPVFPEDELVMVNPVTPLGKWQWSGVPDGGGCKNGTIGQLSSDTGGTHDVTLARACGLVGTWDGGYPAPVYRREGTCYRTGHILGACAAAINLGTKAFTFKRGDFVDGVYYKHYLAPTGGELRTDPITAGTICTAANCNGVWATQSIKNNPWSVTLPSCTPPSGDTGKYQNAYDCAAILLP
jgi:hypothetical protein